MAVRLPESGPALQVHTFDQWRSAARELLARDLAPHLVQWNASPAAAELFGDGSLPGAGVAAEATQPRVQMPRKLIDMLQTAACHSSADRWAFLYRVVWRWQQGEKDVLSAADQDGNRLHAMVKAVRREEHDMHAYLRFRERQQEMGPPRFIAWYEPAHQVLPQVARHFADRMGRNTWVIATPDATVLWDGKILHTMGPLLRGPEDIEDAGETLWLTYYRSIFNPARLNPGIMHGHIRARFWKNLPEARVVPAMVAEAAAGAQRVGQAVRVGQRSGAVIPIAAERARPQRKAETTLEQCRRCPLWEKATQPVAGIGPRQARIMLLGEQPGDQEDIAGTPFVGPAGQLLNKVLAEAGLQRDDVYMTNAVKHFKWEPRGKRRLHKTPAQREIEACGHWLQQELSQVDPEVVLALGSTALKAILGVASVRLADVLAKPFRHDGRWIIAIYHPAYVLRVPDESARQHALKVMDEGFRQAQQLLAQKTDIQRQNAAAVMTALS